MQDNSALGRVARDGARPPDPLCLGSGANARTLRPYLVEEVLELDQAIAGGDPAAIRDEAGDFLLHLAWQIVIGEERGDFTAGQPGRLTERKMRRRHPHLFDLGPAEPWEALKRQERPDGTLAGCPRPCRPAHGLAASGTRSVGRVRLARYGGAGGKGAGGIGGGGGGAAA